MPVTSTARLQDGYHDLAAGKLAAVVTFLEMLEPPPPRPVPPAQGIALQAVPQPDLAWYRDLHRRIGTDWLWSSRLTMTDDQLRAILHDEQVETYVPSRAGRAEGLLELDLRDWPEVELAYFGLTPTLVGSGVGRWLMDQALALAWRPGATRFWVHTCSLDHPAALPFYIRSGFRAYRSAVEVAPDPRLTGVLPREAAPQVPIIEDTVRRW